MIGQMPMGGQVCEVQDDGLYVPSLDCWLDAQQSRAKCFVSHAHTDHYAAHGTIICTPETAALLPLVKPYGESVPPCKTLRTGHTVTHDGAVVTLLPSGHLLGAAMIHVACAGASLLYAGDVRPSGSPTAPPAQVLPADHLVVEDTFGDLHQPFVGPEEGAARVVELCRKLRREGATPVLVTMSSCGKAQDMLLALAEAGFTTALQPKTWHFANLYGRLGVPLRGYVRLDTTAAPVAEVVIASRAYLEHNDLTQSLVRPRFVLVSGWAASTQANAYDAAIPWSDHASREELLQLIAAVRPREVWTFAGKGQLLPELRAAGYEARHLGG